MAFFDFFNAEPKVNLRFTHHDHERLANDFVGHKHIYQALRFGKYLSGDAPVINLMFVVSSDLEYWAYLKIYQGLLSSTRPSGKDVAAARFHAFSTHFAKDDSEDLLQLPGRDPLSSTDIDLILMPNGWENRVSELERDLRLPSSTISTLRGSRVVIKTKH